MRHPTEGALRRLVDEPAGVADADREHVADCPVCLRGLAAAREDAPRVAPRWRRRRRDADAAWARLSTPPRRPRRPPVGWPRRPPPVADGAAPPRVAASPPSSLLPAPAPRPPRLAADLPHRAGRPGHATGPTWSRCPS